MENLLHYNINECLGSGKNGDSLLAWDPGLDRLVMLKLLNRDATAEPSWEESFRASMEALAGVDEKCLIPFYSLERDGDRRFVVRGFASGESVAHRTARGAIGYLIFLKVALSAARALQAVHASDRLHGNICAGNVIVDESGSACLVDAGLGPTRDEISRLEITTRDLVFLAPEQITSGEIDVRSDIYSLGMVLYVLFVGRPPFVTDSTEQLRRMILDESVKFDAARAGRLPGDARLLLRKLLAKAPEDRMADSEELCRTLEEMLSFHTEHGSEPIDSKRSGSPRQYLMLSLLALLLIILWIVISYYR